MKIHMICDTPAPIDRPILLWAKHGFESKRSWAVVRWEPTHRNSGDPWDRNYNPEAPAGGFELTCNENTEFDAEASTEATHWCDLPGDQCP